MFFWKKRKDLKHSKELVESPGMPQERVADPVQEQGVSEKEPEENLPEHNFLDDFPALWDSFEELFHSNVMKQYFNSEDPSQPSAAVRLSSLYQNASYEIWLYSEGLAWRKKVDEIFFDYKYSFVRSLLFYYPKLDDLAAKRMESVTSHDPQEIYQQAVKPFLDERKQELIKIFQEWKVEMKGPFHYDLTVKMGEENLCLNLSFQKQYQKKSKDGMDGYVYTFHDRTYQDIQAFSSPSVERLDKDINITVDTYGEKVLRKYTSIPTFDSGDREWDSEEIEYLMFDGKNVNLVKMRGGYRIASLTFYEKLLSADQAAKPLFEKLGWPLEEIEWT